MACYTEGEPVWVFYRWHVDHRCGEEEYEDLWMPVLTRLAGTCSPRIGQTDGWQPAIVTANYAADDEEGKVRIRYVHGEWYNRRGTRMNDHELNDKVHPSQVRKRDAGGVPLPKVSFLVVRWGGEKDCDPVKEGAGGWGNTGSNVSDSYMYYFFEKILWPTLGPTYQVITITVRDSRDLEQIYAPAIAPMLTAKHKAGLYFLWPVAFQDYYHSPGYVNNMALMALMGKMEACGVTSRFPHHAHLYQVLLSKDWLCHTCTNPALAVPATTKISRSLIVKCPRDAARMAMQALDEIRAFKNQGQPNFQQINKGVVKLGYSWEAMDVRLWNNEDELTLRIQELAQQPCSLTDHVMVQEFVDFDCEMRLFFVTSVHHPQVDAATGQVKLLTPTKILYTRFCTVTDEAMLTDFDRLGREDALKWCFQDDEASLQNAEQQAIALGTQWMLWMRGQCAEAPPVLRMDFMVKHVGPGQSKVTTCELTELGACFLGWEDGPRVVFGALIDSCLKDVCGELGDGVGDSLPAPAPNGHSVTKLQKDPQPSEDVPLGNGVKAGVANPVGWPSVR